MHASLFALAASLSTVAAATQGFNYGAVTRTGAAKFQADFEAEFSAAKGLANTNGAFSSARLYTMIQAGTTNSPIEAIPAAISSGTKLMLGMWASGFDDVNKAELVNNEIAALTAAIEKYGSKFTSLVNGISVGSEDLYRITPTGYMNDPLSVGQSPDNLVKVIQKVRSSLKSTALAKTPIGHVDTWTAWQNGSNSAVIAECDFLGMNTFPYFQTTEANGIENGASLFQAALDITKGAGAGKPVIITETGWPVGGKKSAQAEASTKNAKTYWDEVGCTLFGKTDVYWYTLVDANTDTEKQPQFGVVGTTLKTTPLYDLKCPAVVKPISSTTLSSKTSTGASSAATGGAESNGTASASESVLTTLSTKTSTDAAGSTIIAVSTAVFTSTSTPAQPTEVSGGAGASGNGSSGAGGNGASNGASPASTTSTPAPSDIPGAASASTWSFAASAMAVVAAIMALA